MKKIFSFLIIIILGNLTFLKATPPKWKLPSKSYQEIKNKIQTEKKKLDKGGTPSFAYENKYEVGAFGGIILYAPFKDVWEKALHDWPGLAKHMPSLKYYKVIHKEKTKGKKYQEEYLIEGIFTAAFLSFLYTIRVRFYKESNKKGRLEWNSLSDEEVEAYNKKGIKVKKTTSTIDIAYGQAYLEQISDSPPRTVYYYNPVVKNTVPLPVFIQKKIGKIAVEEFLAAIQQRVVCDCFEEKEKLKDTSKVNCDWQRINANYKEFKSKCDEAAKK